MENSTFATAIKRGAVSLVASGVSMLLMPMPALAGSSGLGWQDIGKETPQGVTAGNVSTFGETLMKAVLGIVIGVFVLKVVLTAVDRIIFGGSNSGGNKGNGNEGFRLDDIPIIGAYRDPERSGDSPWTWQRIFTFFAIQIALAAGAYVIVGLMMSLLSTVFSKI